MFSTSLLNEERLIFYLSKIIEMAHARFNTDFNYRSACKHVYSYMDILYNMYNSVHT